jgi:hypothetical protein
LSLRDLRRQRGWTLEVVALARTFGISIARLRRLLAEVQPEEVGS